MIELAEEQTMKRSEKMAQTRAKILNTASQLYLNNGPKDTDMRDLAHQANISTATLYRYFPTKNELSREIVWQYFAKISKDIEEVLQQPNIDFINAMDQIKAGAKGAVVGVNQEFLTLILDIYHDDPTSIELFNFDSEVWQKIIKLGRSSGGISDQLSDVVVFMYIDMFFQYFKQPTRASKFGLNGEQLGQLDGQLSELFFSGLAGEK
ncbi:TetR/AcrR family transcriptional regulator [Paucilactobacillus kaifaensis]|uniref:TetR/AcrR family transcriptional regulator n=1 Tax=Paucilactobacillus kaifaensis TaxID=2559921 RepID=UPI0010F85606|nr:TetR/AcrR family transcriptional regulator [Paucilactobacillus kaifaensis]